MNYESWVAENSVGNPSMDAFHFIFFKMVVDIRSALDSGEAMDMNVQIEFLVNYLETHIKSEERLLAENRYPALSDHRLAHREFMTRIRAIQSDFQMGTKEVQAEDVLSLMERWFMDHILREDFEYKPFLASVSAT